MNSFKAIFIIIRVSTCGLLVVLVNLYPKHTFSFIMLIVIDIFSHWFHVMRYADFFCLFSYISDLACAAYRAITNLREP